MIVLAAVTAGLSAVGVVQAVAGWIVVRRFARRRVAAAGAGSASGISVLKPLHGNEPLLEEALGSFCRQEFSEFQVVFGVTDPADTALAVVRRVQARFPDCDIAVVVDPARHGRNPKVANLINMLPAARHSVLVIADSDLHVAPNYLASLARALGQPGVGLVTTLYAGLPGVPGPFRAVQERGHWGALLPGRLGAMQINQYLLPGALLARAMGRQDCLGATMVLRRETLERIGGLPALADHLADDNVLGRLVQGLGLRVALADTVPATTVPETTHADLWRHELRWARTIRALVPVEFAASMLQYSLAWAVLTVVLASGALWSLAWFVAAWVVRAVAVRGSDRSLALAFRSPLWLLPLRELMSVAVMIASYAGREVDWRGHTMQAEGYHPR